jgi:hypothetical protein
MSNESDDPGVVTLHSGLVDRLDAGVNRVMQNFWKPGDEKLKKLVAFSSVADIQSKANQLMAEWNGENEPLICPKNVKALGLAFLIDLSQRSSPRLIRILKEVLRRLALERALDEEFIKLTIENLNMVELKVGDIIERSNLSSESPLVDIKLFTRGGVICVDCEICSAIDYCVTCVDYLCGACSRKIHSRGQRRNHKVFSLSRCENFLASCPKPATVECVTTLKRFCPSCFTSIHLPTISMDLRSGPRIINYSTEWESINKDNKYLENLKSVDVSNDWYPFNDRYGTPFVYNFKTRESRRRSPAVIEEESVSICDEESDVSARINAVPLKKLHFPFSA